MDILYSSSDSYAFLTGISIFSLLENNKHLTEINIYIMDNKISELNKEKLIQTVREYNRRISFYPMPNIKKFTGYDIQTGRWNISTFGRLFMASALPDTVHTVLNIDCDTIIEGPLDEIWKVDMTGKVFGGVSECINYRYHRNIGIGDKDYYFNAGVVYLNLDEVRKGDYEKKFVDYIIKHGNSLAYLDQDVLNSVVEQSKKQLLPLKFNVLSIYYYASYKQVTKIRRSKDFYTEAEFMEATKNPCIVHFTTCFLDGVRPWIKGNRHTYRKKFLEYKNKSLWKLEPLWEDKRSHSNKIRQKIIERLPKIVLCEIASFLHGVVVPNHNYKKMKKAVKEYVYEEY